MAKIKPIYLIGAAAIAAYYFRDKLFGSAAPGSDETQELTDKEIKTPDAVIDVKTTGGSIDQAITAAKKIASGYKDIKVLIKTPAGQENIEYTKGQKTPSARKKKRAAAKIKRKGRKTAKRSKAPKGTVTTEAASYAPGYKGDIV